jgi:hypothetical protein
VLEDLPGMREKALPRNTLALLQPSLKPAKTLKSRRFF